LNFFSWFEPPPPLTPIMEPTWIWWAGLSLFTAVRACLICRSASSSDSPTWALAAMCTYAIVAFLRATFPINWATRPHSCLVEASPFTFLGGALFDRFFAQCAEMSLGILMACTSGTHAEFLGFVRSASYARALVLPIAIAQCCCWCGEVSDNKVFHVAEEGLWTATFAAHVAIAVRVWLGTSGAARSRRTLLWIATLSTPYVFFMALVDVPMYYRQWIADEVNGTQYDSFSVGLQRMATCAQRVDRWDEWREEATWQSLYFGAAPFACVALASSLGRSPLP